MQLYRESKRDKERFVDGGAEFGISFTMVVLHYGDGMGDRVLGVSRWLWWRDWESHKWLR